MPRRLDNSDLVMLLILLFTSLTFADDSGEKLDDMSRECRFVVLGRITEVFSTDWSGDGTVATGSIEVRRHLKGNHDARLLEVEFHFRSSLNMEPDMEDVIWFIRRQMDNGRYLVTDWKWSRDSVGRIEAAIARVDKNTRIPGMPPPSVTVAPLSVVLGADDGRGRAVTSVRAHSIHQVRLLAQFQNHGETPLAVMPVIDGSLTRRRFPYYDLEFSGSAGSVAGRQIEAICGNINPLARTDIVEILPGEVFRTRVPSFGYDLGPGKYRVRLKYTAGPPVTAAEVASRDIDDDLKTRIEKVWEGKIVSNWLEIEIPRIDTSAEDLGIRLVFQDLALPTRRLMEENPSYAFHLLHRVKSRAPLLDIQLGDQRAEEFGRLLIEDYPGLFASGAWFLVHAGNSEVVERLEDRVNELATDGGDSATNRFKDDIPDLIEVLSAANPGRAKALMKEIIATHKREHTWLNVILAVELFRLGDRSGLDEVFSQLVDVDLDEAYRNGLASSLASRFGFYRGGRHWTKHQQDMAAWYRANRERFRWSDGTGFGFGEDSPPEEYWRSMNEVRSDSDGD